MSWLTSQKARLIVIAGLSWLYTTFVCTFHVLVVGVAQKL